MEVNAKLVKELRDKTGSGIMDCKQALKECACDIEKAIDFLRKKGLAQAQKRISRETSEGLVYSIISKDKKIGVLLEVNCETDFVAKTEDFQNFVRDIAQFILENNSLKEGVFLFAGSDLASQKYKNSNIEDTVKELIGKIGENIQIKKYAKFQTNSGFVHSYIHTGDKIGTLIKVDINANFSEKLTDFFNNISMHITAINPIGLKKEDVPLDIIEREREIAKAKALEQGKPANIIDKIIEGQIQKFYKDVCLLSQPYVKEPKITMQDFLKATSKELNSEVSIKQFCRFQIGA